MRKPIAMLALGVLLASVSIAPADQLKLSSGGNLGGTVAEATFLVNDAEVTYVRNEIEWVRIDGGALAPDRLRLKDGQEMDALLVSVQFRTVAGVLPFTRRKVRGIEIKNAPSPTSRAASQPAAHYDDTVKLASGHEIKVAVAVVKALVNRRPRSFFRADLAAVALSDKPQTLVTLRNGEKVEAAVLSITLRAGSTVAVFDRARIARIDLRDADLAKVPAPLTERQSNALIADGIMYRKRMRWFQGEKEAARELVKTRLAAPLKAANARVASLSASVYYHRSTVSVWQENLRKTRDLLKRPSSEDMARQLKQAEARGTERLEKAGTLLKQAEQDLVVVRPVAAALAAHKRVAEAALAHWAATGPRALATLRDQHRVILSAGVILTRRQREADYENAVEPFVIPEAPAPTTRPTTQPAQRKPNP